MLAARYTIPRRSRGSELRRDNNAEISVEVAREERLMTGKGERTEITSNFVGKGRVRERATRRYEGRVPQKEAQEAQKENLSLSKTLRSFRRRRNTRENDREALSFACKEKKPCGRPRDCVMTKRHAQKKHTRRSRGCRDEEEERERRTGSGEPGEIEITTGKTRTEMLGHRNRRESLDAIIF